LKETSNDNYRPTTEEWYTQVMQSGKVPRKAAIEDEYIAVSANTSLLDSDRKTIGVIGVDFQLTDVGRFLRSLTISPNSRIFIIERTTGTSSYEFFNLRHWLPKSTSG
jgi:sigma-B regulation protein RsbU (phosphoserine phosphatase)